MKIPKTDKNNYNSKYNPTFNLSKKAESIEPYSLIHSPKAGRRRLRAETQRYQLNFVQHQYSRITSLFDCLDPNQPELIGAIPELLKIGLDANETLDGEPLIHKIIAISQAYEGSPIWKDFLNALNSLIEHGANINTVYGDNTPIELAFEVYLVPKMDEDKYTINGLHLAQILKPFLNSGFDPYTPYKLGKYKIIHPQGKKQQESFFEYALRHNYYEVSDLISGDSLTNNILPSKAFEEWDMSEIRKMLDQGYSFDHFALFSAFPVLNYLSPPNSWGLCKLSRQRCQTAMKILIENGFDIRKTNHEGNTILHQAAKLGNREIIELLLKNGADCDLESKNIKGQTPLMIAALSQQAESFDCLIRHGANLDTILPSPYPHCKLRQYIKRGQFQLLIEGLHQIPNGLRTFLMIYN